jgi:hypothetical protein
MFFSRRLCLALGIILIQALPASAYTISVLVVETGLHTGSPPAESSNLWESGLMDILFDEGHIVSNAPILRLEQRSSSGLPEEARDDLNAARAGGADFLILALLDYQGAPGTGGNPKPQQVSLRVFRINPYQLIAEEPFTGGNNPRGGDEFINARNAARIIIPHIKG